MPVSRLRSGFIIASVLVVLLAACAGPTVSREIAPAPARKVVNLSGYSEAFKQGYAQGCDSVREARQRDAQRYGSDNDYTMGWNDGYSMCGGR